MPLLGHHFLNIIDIILQLKGDELAVCHDRFDRHTLIDESRSSKGIIGSADQHTISHLCHLKNFGRDLRTAAYDHTAGIQFQRTSLHLFTVAQDHQIVFFHIFLDAVLVTGCHDHLSMHEIAVLITVQQCTVQGFQHIAKTGSRL